MFRQFETFAPQHGDRIIVRNQGLVDHNGWPWNYSEKRCVYLVSHRGHTSHSQKCICHCISPLIDRSTKMLNGAAGYW